MARTSLRFTILIALVALLLSGCAAMNKSSSDTASEGAAHEDATSSAQAAEPAGPPIGVPPPANSPLAKVSMGMAPPQVTEILGQPTHQTNYMTGKAWIPFYFGPDTHRMDYKYKGMGRVVFSMNRWNGAQKVVRIDYDPDEGGY